MVIVKKVKHVTCNYPDEWEGELSDGRMIYARYRGQVLEVMIGDTISDAMCARWKPGSFMNPNDVGEYLLGKSLPDKDWGKITYERMVKETKEVAVWPKHETWWD